MLRWENLQFSKKLLTFNYFKNNTSSIFSAFSFTSDEVRYSDLPDECTFF